MRTLRQVLPRRAGNEPDAENLLGYVVGISWHDAPVLRLLNAKTGLPYRLPEAEWSTAPKQPALRVDRMCDMNIENGVLTGMTL